MFGNPNVRLLAVVIFVLAGLAGAATKRVTGLVFRALQSSKPNCIPSFYVSQVPDAFFNDLKPKKVQGTIQYQRGPDVVEKFPDFIEIQIVGGPELPTTCSSGRTFDPATLKFHAMWKNSTRTLPASGKIVESQRAGPGLWCEDKCQIFGVTRSESNPRTCHLEINSFSR